MNNLVPLKHIVPSNNRQRNLKQRGVFRVESCCTCLYLIFQWRAFSSSNRKLHDQTFVITYQIPWSSSWIDLYICIWFVSTYCRRICNVNMWISFWTIMSHTGRNKEGYFESNRVVRVCILYFNGGLLNTGRL
jgi:hypothetical protein